MPVNFVTAPGISLRTACFADGVYDAGGATRCFSNLLAAGYRRYTLDVYWDVDRSTWNLCPVQIGNVGGGASIFSLPRITSTPVIALSTVRITERDAVLPTPWAAIRNFIGRRQAQSSSSSPTSSSLSSSIVSVSESSSSTVTVSASLVSSSSAPTVSSSTSSIPSYFINDTVIDAGSYRCSTNLTLLFFMGTLAEFLGKSMNTLEASLIYLTLDIHTAVPRDDPDGIAPTPNTSDLPVGGQFLSTVLGQNLSSYLYTPSELISDRADLNNSWYKLPFESQPDVSYYETVRQSSTVYSTPDGWPGESYIEFQKSKRLLVEFGNVDIQMRNYNFSADEAAIFQHNFIRTNRNVSISGNGTVTRGCYLVDGDYRVSSSNNNSWAEASFGSSELQSSEQNFANGTFYSVGNMSACGISPFLNQTLNNATADENLAPYLIVPLSAIWSWAPGEPRNVSSDEENSDSLRCAVMDMSLRGRWRVADCNDHFNWACRTGSTPYEWQISEDTGSYEGVAAAGCG
ncbi:MAG: C-type lectin domain-containing protein, partial [Terriglobus roseus]|nr:C-type lectin domain-containing protein [Terriglobus roseus]